MHDITSSDSPVAPQRWLGTTERRHPRRPFPAAPPPPPLVSDSYPASTSFSVATHLLKVRTHTVCLHLIRASRWPDLQALMPAARGGRWPVWLWLAAGLWPRHTGRVFNSPARRVARLHGLKNRDIWAPPPRQTRDLKSHQFLGSCTCLSVSRALLLLCPARSISMDWLVIGSNLLELK
jgi:hypothetical protein